MSDNYPHWEYEEDLVLQAYDGLSPYKQGNITKADVEEVLDRYKPTSVPNLTQLTQYEVVRRPQY